MYNSHSPLSYNYKTMKTEYEVKTAPRSTAMPHYYVKYDSELRYTIIEPVKTVIDVQNNNET